MWFGGVREATYIKPKGPISGHLMQAIGQLLGYPRHLQEQMSTAYDSISSQSLYNLFVKLTQPVC